MFSTTRFLIITAALAALLATAGLTSPAAAATSRASVHRKLVRLQRQLDLTVQNYDRAVAAERDAATSAGDAARAYRRLPGPVRNSALGAMFRAQAEQLEARQSNSWIAIGRTMGLEGRIRLLIARERTILARLPRPVGPAFFSSAATNGITAQALHELLASGVLRGRDPGRRAARAALRELGVPYHWGGESSAGFDCSGLTQYAFGQIGITIPRVAAAQMASGKPVSVDHLQPGDLVFFERGIGHVAMYVGDGLIIEAPHTGAVVWLAQLGDSWHRDNYQGAVQPW